MSSLAPATPLELLDGSPAGTRKVVAACQKLFARDGNAMVRELWWETGLDSAAVHSAVKWLVKRQVVFARSDVLNDHIVGLVLPGPRFPGPPTPPGGGEP